MTTKKRVHKKRVPVQHPIPPKTKTQPRRVVFYGRVCRVDEPVDIDNNKVRSIPIVSEYINHEEETDDKYFSAMDTGRSSMKYKDLHNNTAQPTAVIFLRARHLGPSGPDRVCEQQMIILQRAACDQAAQELNAQVIREYVEYGGTGNIDTRPVLRRMLDELHAQRDATYLIVTKKDRLARQPHDRARLAREIHAVGAKIVTTDDPDVRHDSQTISQ